ncbi:hypothetical protein C0991_010110 [Blastosporella zonata]|nr:hypothetical protein C0991_010110 [Blastosporella zonata]
MAADHIKNLKSLPFKFPTTHDLPFGILYLSYPDASFERLIMSRLSLLVCFVGFLALLFSVVGAQSLGLSDLPTCAQTCANTAAIATGCAFNYFANIVHIEYLNQGDPFTADYHALFRGHLDAFKQRIYPHNTWNNNKHIVVNANADLHIDHDIRNGNQHRYRELSVLDSGRRHHAYYTSRKYLSCPDH